MASLFGTLVTVKDFLNDVEMPIEVVVSADRKVTAFTLPQNREYVIPAYQREIRWETKQLQELVRDVTEGKRFLGNIILSKKENRFEIIDGQQRVTVLRMLISYINNISSNPASLPLICPCGLIIDSFPKYHLLHENNYSFDSLDSSVITEIIESDYYHQHERYIELWAQIKHAPELTSNSKMRTFLECLQECQVNLIITDEGNSNSGIEYFVDVNQKGVRLDDEDTLKGYLFQFNAEAVKPLWIEIKRETFKITKELQCKYSLLLLFEQYFYCELYKKSLYESLKFKRDFTLEEDFKTIEGRDRYENSFPKDTHLIQVLRDNRDLIKDLKRILSAAKMIRVILENQYPPAEFKSELNPHILSGSDKLGTEAINCIFGLLQKVFKDANEVPKALALKYILDVLLNDELKNKSEVGSRKSIKQKYYSVFSLYALACLFTMFASKKQGVQIYNAIKGSDWELEVSKCIKKFLNAEAILKNQTTIAYRTFCKNQNEDTRRDAWRCKAMATLYNFLFYDKNRKIYTFKKHEELFCFLEDNVRFSLEHFLLNDSLGCTITTLTTPVMYPASIKKYIGSMFNFIYISKKINSLILKNRCLPEKIQILNKNGQAYNQLSDNEVVLVEQNPITCTYSKMVLELLQSETNLFCRYNEVCNTHDSEKIEQYFETEFEIEYSEFVECIVTRFLAYLRLL